MTMHKRYKQELTCPECGLTGEVEFDTNETSAHHDGRLDVRIVSLPKGFEKGQRQDDVVCARCEVLIPH
jgi:hypothetical protein